MTDTPRKPAEPPPADAKAERLAKALRDNLRRRKAPPPAPDRRDEPAGEA